MDNSILNNPRLIKKKERLEEGKQLINFYEGKPNNLTLKKTRQIRKQQFVIDSNSKIITSNQYDLFNFENNLNKFKEKLSLCGNYITTNYHCKQCESEGNNDMSLLAFKKEIHTCGIRYCPKIDCIIQRFASTYEALDSIKRFQDLRTLHHFVIGFEKINKKDFENNFNKVKKRQEYVLNSFFKRLRKINIKIQGYRVLDISMGKTNDEKYYMHYHFIAIPFKKSETRLITSKIQMVRKDMITKQKIKTPFHFQSFGLKEKSAMFSYMSLRAIGCYKKFENKEKDYKIYEAKSLRKSLEEGKFMLLKDLITPKQYLQFFFNKRHLNKIGDMPPFRYGSITANNIVWVMCKNHGKLRINDRDNIRIETFIEKEPPPPPNPTENKKIKRFQLANGLSMETKTQDEYKELKKLSKFNQHNSYIPKFEDNKAQTKIEVINYLMGLYE